MMNLKGANFVKMVDTVAQRSNCVRRSVGTVLVRGDDVIAEGWNGIAESDANCRDAGCPRCINGGDTGSGYETCICIHAEQRAIADAANRGICTRGSILYVNLRPCLQCLAISKAAGVRQIVYWGEEWRYPAEIETLYKKLAAQFESFGHISELSVHRSR